MAAIAHNSTFGYFPNAGGVDGASRSKTSGGVPKRAIEQDWGVFYQILPQLEQQGIYSNPNDAEVAALKFKLYFCPTRRPPATVTGSTANGLAATALRGGIDYAGSGGDSQGAPVFPVLGSLERQNGVIVPRPNAHPMHNTGRPITDQEISDGLSNVLMFGERNFNRKPIGVQQDENNGYFNGWSFDTVRWGNQRPQTDRPAPNESTATTYDHRFGSSHPGIVLMVLCDGSVKAFPLGQQSITDLTFRQLVNRGDGKTPQLP
jgi:hypothetical protein